MAYGGPSRPWCSWFMPLSCVACIAVFVYTMYVNNCPKNLGEDRCVFHDHLGRFSFQPRSENSLFGPSTATLKKLGGLSRNLVVYDGEIYRFFSCMWLHANVIHLLTNSLAILFIGVKLEEDFGFLRIGLLYVLSGFGGGLLSCLHQDESQQTLQISVGASGALFGLLGASLSEIITNWTLYTNKCVSITMLILVIGVNMAIGFMPGIDNMAHIGGFVSGILLGFILLLRPQYGYVSGPYIAPGYELNHKKPKYQCHQKLLWVISVVVLFVW
ncbi:hypothetical protein WN944_022318 [Citrus x changshan-huyou]|nr:RHOMBOID-like protein 5 [Citrus sinensis]